MHILKSQLLWTKFQEGKTLKERKKLIYFIHINQLWFPSHQSFQQFHKAKIYHCGGQSVSFHYNFAAYMLCFVKKGAQYLQMEQVTAEIRTFLATNPSDSELTDFLNHLHPSSVKPTGKLHQTDLASLHAPTVLSAHLMVQDIRDVYYYISFAIAKPYNGNPNVRKFNQACPFYIYKYGNTVEDQPADLIQSKDYMHVMTQRFPVACTPILYQTKWANELEGATNLIGQITLEVDESVDQFKLGEVINVVTLYDPEFKKLFFIRKMSEQEVEEEALEVVAGLAKKQVDAPLARQQLMNFLCGYCSQTFAEFLLFTLISEEPFFLGCQANITPLIVQLFPRVAHIKIVHPCQQSLFPFKDQQSVLHLTPMQLSSLRTFVVLDFSEFSTKQKVVLAGTELENFSALKMFVEEAETIYRWEIGESHVKHQHIGLVVKAAQLITPHFVPKNQSISPDLTITLLEETKQTLRQYLQRVMSLDPKLSEEERKLIEKDLAEQTDKKYVGENLGKIMKLSKLLARSYGREVITHADYQRSKEMIALLQDSK